MIFCPIVSFVLSSFFSCTPVLAASAALFSAARAERDFLSSAFVARAWTASSAPVFDFVEFDDVGGGAISLGRGCFAFSALKPGGGGAADPPVVLLEVSVDIHRFGVERAISLIEVEGSLARWRRKADVIVAEEGVEYNRKGARTIATRLADVPSLR
jgi:hypothetical protein